ncbi:UxaA family hydrolase [Tissierellaceae bacterium HCP3S3_D8]
MNNALVIDPKDNVAVAIEQISKGTEVNYILNGELGKVVAKDDIQIYHKISIKNIKRGEPIVKYGEHMGLAGVEIEKGQHVHVHNVEDHREKL